MICWSWLGLIYLIHISKFIENIDLIKSASKFPQMQSLVLVPNIDHPTSHQVYGVF